jgi:hypothetical protein
MPIALSPSDTVDVVLDLDSEKPEPRPTFTCRHLSCADTLKVEAMTAEAYELDKSLDGKTNADLNNLLTSILTVQLAAWKNIEKDGKAVPFSPAAFDDVLTPMEKWELIATSSAMVRLDFLLKKKSLWERRSAAANSARTASASESATSPPADTTASTSPASNAAGTGQ